MLTFYSNRKYYESSRKWNVLLCFKKIIWGPQKIFFIYLFCPVGDYLMHSQGRGPFVISAVQCFPNIGIWRFISTSKSVNTCYATELLEVFYDSNNEKSLNYLFESESAYTERNFEREERLRIHRLQIRKIKLMK